VSDIKSSASLALLAGKDDCIGNIHADEIPESLCRSHIERVVGSVTFARAEQLRQLLKWLADWALEPHAGAPSEKEIAVHVLNRRDFDPQTDSLVRKEMSRLREKLSRYYSSEGRLDEIRVDTSGGYLVTFSRLRRSISEGHRPCWLMLPFRAHSSTAEQSEELFEELLMTLGENGGADLVASTTAMAYRGRLGDVRQFAAECNADFVIEGSLRMRDELLEAMTWMIDGQSGRVLRSRRITGACMTEVARNATAWLLGSGETH